MYVDKSQGRVFWGGSDRDYYEPPMTYVNVLSKGYFNVSMEAIEVVGHQPFCAGRCFAIIDTGTSLIGGPEDIIDPINRQIGGKKVRLRNKGLVHNLLKNKHRSCLQ